MKLSPRFVFITDGFPTNEMSEDAEDSSWITDQDIRQVANAFGELRSRQINDGLPNPVVFVPLGRTVNMACLKTLAYVCGGMVTESESFLKMAQYQRLHVIAAKALRAMKSRGVDAYGPLSGFRTYISQIGFDDSDLDVGQVHDLVKKNTEKVVVHSGSKYSFYNICEETDLPLLGSRVNRGPDWMWGIQDGEGAGTVINHNPDKMVWVCWDNDHVNVYRYGHNGKHDLVIVNDQPRVMETCALNVGFHVQRGPDWHSLYQDQDGGPGHYGVIIRINQLGKVMVRWQNGKIYDYRCGSQNKSDVTIYNPIASILHSSLKADFDVQKMSGNEKLVDKQLQDPQTLYQWQRKNDINGWEPYSNANNAKLQRAYLKNPRGTCLIQRQTKSFRISFRTLKERCLETGSLIPVRLQNGMDEPEVNEGGDAEKYQNKDHTRDNKDIADST